MIARSRFFFDLDFLPMRLRILPEFGTLLQNVQSVSVKLRHQFPGAPLPASSQEGDRVVARLVCALRGPGFLARHELGLARRELGSQCVIDGLSLRCVLQHVIDVDETDPDVGLRRCRHDSEDRPF